MSDSIFEYTPEDGAREFLAVEPNADGSAVIRVSSLRGGYATIELPADQLGELGRKLLTRAKAYV